MKSTLPVALLLVTIVRPAGAAELLFSDPVGLVELGNTDESATAAVEPDTDVFLTIPLETAVAFTGTVAATDATSIRVSGSPGWASGDWSPATGAPFVAIIGSGAEQGLRGVITANTSDTLSVTLTTPGDLGAVVAGDTVRIRPCWTLASFFADSDLSNNCQVLLFDETADGVNHSSAANHLYYAGDWYDASSAELSNDVVLHPGELFILRSSSAPISQLSVYGEVPLVPQRTDVSKDAVESADTTEDIELGHMFPVPLLLDDLALPAGNNDQILIYDNQASGVNKSSARNLIHYEGTWYDGATGLAAGGSFRLEPGQGFIFRRSHASTLEPVEWRQPSP